MTTSRCLDVSASASTEGEIKYSIGGSFDQRYSVLLLRCSDMERLFDPNSSSILIVCGRLLQFSFDWMFVVAVFAVIKVVDDSTSLNRPYTLDFYQFVDLDSLMS
jgi:hypothetical protein